MYKRQGGSYGGGAGGKAAGGDSSIVSAQGAIRIMWPGNERSYPNTRVPDE